MAQTLRDIMTTNVRTLPRDASVAEAARLMRDIDVGIVPIVDGDVLAGVITDRDIVVRVIADGRDPEQVRVEEIFSRGVTVASPDWDLRHTADVMASEQIRRLPVVEGTRLVGIVSLGDLAVEGNKDSLSAKAIEGVSEPSSPDL